MQNMQRQLSVCMIDKNIIVASVVGVGCASMVKGLRDVHIVNKGPIIIL